MLDDEEFDIFTYTHKNQDHQEVKSRLRLAKIK